MKEIKLFILTVLTLVVLLPIKAQDLTIGTNQDGLPYSLTTIGYSDDVALSFTYFPTILQNSKEISPYLTITIVDPALKSIYPKDVKKAIIRIGRDEIESNMDFMGEVCRKMPPQARQYIRDVPLPAHTWHKDNIIQVFFLYWFCQIDHEHRDFYSILETSPSKVRKEIESLLYKSDYGRLELYCNEYSTTPDYSIFLSPQAFEAIKKLHQAFK
ncbi:MAG: hypothetical protein IJR02_11745 [Bacteroidaceae bacterium]|nr:hypothetical protein [Bacteroidaceae bacterium]